MALFIPPRGHVSKETNFVYTWNFMAFMRVHTPGLRHLSQAGTADVIWSAQVWALLSPVWNPSTVGWLIIETTPNTFTSNWWRSSSNGRCPSVRDADYTDTWKLVGPTSSGASESRHIRDALVNLRLVPHHAADVSVAIFAQTSSF
jgi:hypothetical protein